MAFGVLHRFACDIGPFLTPLCKFYAMARGRGLPLPTVFTLHSAFAGVCGALALLVPAFFGQVFPDLASPVGRPALARLARHPRLACAAPPALLPSRAPSPSRASWD